MSEATMTPYTPPAVLLVGDFGASTRFVGQFFFEYFPLFNEDR